MVLNIKKTNFVLVTGACGRIASEVVFYIAKKGYNLLIIDINESSLAELKSEILIQFPKVEVKYFSIDCTSDKSIKSILNWIFLEKIIIFGAIMLAYPRPQSWGMDLLELDQESLDFSLTSHLGSSILWAKHLIPHFKENNSGKLIYFSSIQGLFAPKFNHYENTSMSSPIEYTAIKHGIVGITKWLAKKYLKDNIKVNCICPGGITADQPKDFIQSYQKDTGSLGMLDPRDIFETVGLLLSNESRAITGQCLIIDDGWSL